MPIVSGTQALNWCFGQANLRLNRGVVHTFREVPPKSYCPANSPDWTIGLRLRYNVGLTLFRVIISDHQGSVNERYPNG